jgi:arginase family enzyme
MNARNKPGSWPSIADLIVGEGPADVALIGAPMDAGSVTPGRCDLAPAAIRKALRRFSTYDVETRHELALAVADAGDIPVQSVLPAEGFEPIRDGVATCAATHQLTILLGGNNAVTRPAAHALGYPIGEVGLITLDAHFDLRDTDQGLLNGNPVRALLEDGLPGANICQIGLSPFANTARMHATALEAGIGVVTMAEVKRLGIVAVLEGALARLSHCPAIMVDFDIDVIDRSQCPGAPGARPGGMPVDMFFAAPASSERSGR